MKPKLKKNTVIGVPHPKSTLVKDNFNEMCQEIAKYIKSKSGKVSVIGGIGIRQRPPLKYNFTFEIDFTGTFPIKKVVKNKVGKEHISEKECKSKFHICQPSPKKPCMCDCHR